MWDVAKSVAVKGIEQSLLFSFNARQISYAMAVRAFAVAGVAMAMRRRWPRWEEWCVVVVAATLVWVLQKKEVTWRKPL